MENYLKFIGRLPKNLRLKVIKAVEDLANNKLQNLDIKRLSAPYELYRCRVGKIRILFQKRYDKNFVLDIGFRGDIYKKLGF
ncbi:type II toxin-antitoxin system RelE/ParE family toxin [Candidatus Peregrinibacteria bacterium]|nr:type II toxin-antitoxin system RelE/ParE family toxin [Candidatus Peregrinibacteria bacterium]